MGASIFVLHDDGKIVEVRETVYDSESLLQQLLAKYPNILAGDQMDVGEPRRWVLVSREMRVPDAEDASGRWSLDHLFLDQDGVPTLVEVKRSSDSRIRREVVGQMLDYAANAVVYWPVESILSRFQTTCEECGTDAQEVLQDLVGADGDIESFWQQVKTNLQAGKVRLVFVADFIPSELRRVIEFLNQQMNPAEVLGVEIKQFVGEGLKTLVPKLIGRTESAVHRKAVTAGREVIPEERFWAMLESIRSTEECRVVRNIISWAKNADLTISFRADDKVAVFAPSLEHDGHVYYPFAVNSKGVVSVLMRWLKSRAPFDDSRTQDALYKRLSTFPGLLMKAAGMQGFPRVPLADLIDNEARRRMIETLDWIVSKIRAT